MASMKKLPAFFYQNSNGREPVREWLLELDAESRRTVGRDVATADFGWPVGMPLSRSLGGGLHELRSSITGKRIARVIYMVHEERLVLLHAFVKKTRRTPKADLDLARARGREIRS